MSIKLTSSLFEPSQLFMNGKGATKCALIHIMINAKSIFDWSEVQGPICMKMLVENNGRRKDMTEFKAEQ